MDGEEFFDGLEFDDQLARKKDVEHEVLVENLSLVDKRKSRLKLASNPLASQFTGEGLLINRLEQSRPHFPMDLHRSPNDAVRQWIALFPDLQGVVHGNSPVC